MAEPWGVCGLANSIGGQFTLAFSSIVGSVTFSSISHATQAKLDGVDAEVKRVEVLPRFLEDHVRLALLELDMCSGPYEDGEYIMLACAEETVDRRSIVHFMLMRLPDTDELVFAAIYGHLDGMNPDVIVELEKVERAEDVLELKTFKGAYQETQMILIDGVLPDYSVSEFILAREC